MEQRTTRHWAGTYAQVYRRIRWAEPKGTSVFQVVCGAQDPGLMCFRVVQAVVMGYSCSILDYCSPLGDVPKIKGMILQIVA